MWIKRCAISQANVLNKSIYFSISVKMVILPGFSTYFQLFRRTSPNWSDSAIIILFWSTMKSSFDRVQTTMSPGTPYVYLKTEPQPTTALYWERICCLSEYQLEFLNKYLGNFTNEASNACLSLSRSADNSTRVRIGIVLFRTTAAFTDRKDLTLTNSKLVYFLGVSSSPRGAIDASILLKMLANSIFAELEKT